MACGGAAERAPLAVATCSPWQPYLADPVAGDRVVACHERDLAVQSTLTVDEARVHWSAVLAAEGLVLLADDSRPPPVEGAQPMVATTWGTDAPAVALAISHDTVTHVSLASLP